MTQSTLFVGLGFQKCATTWLSQQLAKHERTWLPPVNELHYWTSVEAGKPLPAQTRYRTRFETRLAAGPKKPQAARLRQRLAYYEWYAGAGSDGTRDYLEYFPGRADADAFGEICPSYVGLSEATLGRIAAAHSEVRGFIILREPVARMWSQLRHESRLRGLDLSDRAAVLAYLDAPRARVQADYAGVLDRAGRAFGEGRFATFFHEDLAADPTAFLTGVCAFLGLEATERVLSLPETRREARGGTGKPDYLAAAMAERFGDPTEAVAARVGRVPDAWRKASA